MRLNRAFSEDLGELRRGVTKVVRNRVGLIAGVQQQGSSCELFPERSRIKSR